MAGRRIDKDENVRSLTKTSGGTSYSITLPMAVVKGFKWKERQKLQLVVNAGTKTILIKDWKKSAPKKVVAKKKKK